MNEGDSRATTVVAGLRGPQSSEPAGESCLVQIYGPGLGKKVPLEQAEMTVGRDSGAELVLRLDNVSRRHCRFLCRDERVFLVDLGSTNGTYLNDREIPPHEEVELRTGDHIHIGAVIFKFLYGGNIEALYHEEIYQTTIVDALTQLYNRRYFFDFLDREMSRSDRHHRPLSLILFDLDHFKEINDRFGHVAGDHVLREMAQVVKGQVRREDCLARYGGEEFVIATPENDVARARILAEKVRALVDTHTFRFERQQVDVSISLGVAELTPGMREPADFVRAADAALYAAKDAGRNRVAG